MYPFLKLVPKANSQLNPTEENAINSDNKVNEKQPMKVRQFTILQSLPHDNIFKKIKNYFAGQSSIPPHTDYNLLASILTQIYYIPTSCSGPVASRVACYCSVKDTGLDLDNTHVVVCFICK